MFVPWNSPKIANILSLVLECQCKTFAAKNLFFSFSAAFTEMTEHVQKCFFSVTAPVITGILVGLPYAT